MANLENLRRVGKQRAEAALQRRRMREHLVDHEPFVLLRGIASLLQCVEHPRGTRNKIGYPVLDVGRHGPLRGERRIIVAAGQRHVHLGDAPSGLRHVAQIRRLLLALGRRIAAGEHALFIDKAVEIGRRHGPGVALVLDERMHDRHRAFALAFDKFDAAQQRRRVGETGDFGQETAHLDLGIDAGFEFAIDLDDIVVVDQRGAVGLLGFDGADVLRLFDRSIGKLCRGPELEAQCPCLVRLQRSGRCGDCAAEAR